MSKFHYHAVVGQPNSFELLHIRISGRTAASSDMNDVYKAERLFGKISVRIGMDPSYLVSTYKKLKELNETIFVNFSHDNEKVIAPIKAAIKVILDRKSVDGFDAQLATTNNQESEFCSIS